MLGVTLSVYDEWYY